MVVGVCSPYPRTRPRSPVRPDRPVSAATTGRGVSVGDVNMARRLGVIAVCAVSLVACVGLAWWQWERFDSAGGSWQNLGYVLQWPLFGLFPAFMFWRMRKLNAEHRPAAPRPTPAAPPPEPWRPEPRRVSGPDDDPELAEYNRYLAGLNAKDQQEHR